MTLFTWGDVVVKSFIRLAFSCLFAVAVLSSLVLAVLADYIGPH